MPQIYDMGPTALLPLRRKACWGYFRPKNPTASAGFEPSNLGTKGQHATPRPPKPLVVKILRKKIVLFIETSFMYNKHSAVTLVDSAVLDRLCRCGAR